ncbi:N-acetyl-gamma-glutamyl-phosphate reductase [Xinfangfangia sp. CPCC 101601]|uniref:N-acetyl-gamma-glutamyl-phosphate reductase n=1 Tax=Pseudogemmobacter lacusdianii TaxID=3069608 RepID=A0ABU0W2Q6_9RHOB|nr:N-acetyl-gamma-glutamyl-phosphate reductase [Xinfangfangia sp. CPCC 101601]MDQ2067365.1 N-acetyl-gamma-glutamyl-phosphate reductase [Xinfangfangia sp. CPCC 101601]
MTHKVFIDGDVGTTGLQIRERLERRADIQLIRVDPSLRKDVNARVAAFAEADVGILCLPDPAAEEIVAACDAQGVSARIIDASTAHRIHPAWTFGLPELAPGQREAVASAARVSNPGCWSTSAIALLRPLVDAGVIAADADIAISGVSGYSGGGKSMIEEFEAGTAQGSFLYGATQSHKHLPEIVAYGRLSKPPVFVPSVGQYAQGMAVAVQLTLSPKEQARAAEALRDHYAASAFIAIVEAEAHQPRVNPQALNGTNRLELSVQGNPQTGATALIAVLDNLGKGASGAAVQNLNLMLGLDETTGL